MEQNNIQQNEELQQEIINYDVYITKLTENNIIDECSFYDEKFNMNIPNIASFKLTKIIELKNNYKLVKGSLVELTTEEKEALKPKSQPSPQEILNAQLLKSNAETKIELDKQKQLNSQLLLEIAKLKQGGATIV